MKVNQNMKYSTRKSDRRLKIFDLCLLVVKWLCLSLKSDKPSIPLQLLLDLCSKLSVRLKARGVKDTIAYMKATRGNFYNYLSGNPLRHPGSACYGVSQFPSILGPLKKYVDDDNYDVLRLVLTILTSTRAIKLKGPVNTDSITQPVHGDVPDLTQDMPAF